MLKVIVRRRTPGAPRVCGMPDIVAGEILVAYDPRSACAELLAGQDATGDQAADRRWAHPEDCRRFPGAFLLVEAVFHAKLTVPS